MPSPARVEELFAAAWGLPPEERAQLLAHETAGDPSLQQEVEELIKESLSAAGLFTASEISPDVADQLADDLVRAKAGESRLGFAEAILDLAVGPQPQQIGKYRIIRLIAMGGMGAVYEAEQASPSRRVALKCPRGPMLSPDAARRFRDEAQILGRLQHPGIAQVYEAGTFRRGSETDEQSKRTPPHPFFAMELVRGAPITQYASEHNLDRSARLSLIAEVCDAVEHAHQRGIIHRDLKPGNIFIDEHGRVKVLDFGIAKLIDRSASATQHTEAGRLLGTLAYMSPEQRGAADGEADVDTRSDVYSLGVVLLELLTGVLPRAEEKSSAPALQRALQKGREETGYQNELRNAEALSVPRESLDDDTLLIIETALALDRTVRYQSVAELAADLRRLLRNEPILARRPSTWYVLKKFARRNRAPVAAAIILAVSASALLGTAYVRIAQAEKEARRQHLVARGTVDFLINEVIEDLERISGTRSINRRVMERLLNNSAAMLAQQPHDRQLLASHASLLHRMGNLEHEEGQSSRAHQLHREALAILTELAERFPDEPDYRMNLAILTTLISYGGDGPDRPIPLNLYTKSLEIDRQLVAEYPESRRYLDNLGHSYERLGTYHVRRNEIEDGEPLLRRRLEIAAELMQRFPESPKSALGLCTGNGAMAEAMRRNGRYDAAVQYARAAVDAGELLMEYNPHHLWYTRSYIHALRNLALAHGGAGDAEAALKQLDRALAKTESVMRENPDDKRFVNLRQQLTGDKISLNAGAAQSRK